MKALSKSGAVLRVCAGLAAAAALAFGATSAAVAQPFPNKPIRIVVPFPPGSGSDSAARIMAQPMSDILKQPVVVENRAGASGIVGTEYVKRAAGDPYTMVLAASTTHAANLSLFKSLPYDPVKDFTPIAKIGMVAFVLMVQPSFPASNVKEFIAYAKANPDKLSFGHGTAGMLAAATLFSKTAGFKAQAIPYKGNPPALADLIGGQIQFSFVDMGAANAQVKGGKLKALAVTLNRRSGLAPDIPTFAESGVPGVEVAAWVGLLTAAGIPPEAKQKLVAAAMAALELPDTKTRLMSAGFDVDPGDGDALARTIDADIKHWARMLKDAGVQPE